MSPPTDAPAAGRPRGALAARLAGRARWVRYGISGALLRRRLGGPRLLRAFARAYPDARFVEIGANDGDRWDHLAPHVREGRWRGIMVEPVPYVFARLERNVGHLAGLALENVAVAPEAGRLPFFHLAEADAGELAELPDFYDGLGSFDESILRTHAPKIPDFEERLVRTEVEAITYPELCARHGFGEVDLVLVDTEGYDAVIVEHLDLEQRRPRLVIYEHFHLAPATRDRLRARLERLDYRLIEEGFDTFCVDVRPDDAFSRRARRLRPAVPAVSAADEDR